jgi:hypothetical protein
MRKFRVALSEKHRQKNSESIYDYHSSQMPLYCILISFPCTHNIFHDVIKLLIVCTEVHDRPKKAIKMILIKTTLSPLRRSERRWH